MMPLVVFSYLQVLDFLSTVAFVLLGVHEANPVVRFALSISETPLIGLVLVKVLAIMLAAWCWQLRRTRALVTANFIFASLICWNLLAIIVGAAQVV